ncbi:hypothetical protein [Pedobacter sp. WC2423]|uniref:hypothetical protein n=1 Tax=Pedobacter sp. WC2423 TaxID=3234142 RepID=UPI0034654E1D
MIKISCPYNWICGREFTTEELSSHDRDFVISAAAKKMKLIFIDCPVCKVSFSYNPSTNESIASGMMNPDQKEKKGPVRKTLKEFNTLLKKDKVAIPKEYLDYLLSEQFKAKPEVWKDQDSFELFSYDALREVVNIDGKDYVTARQLKGFALSLSELGEETDQLDKSIVIGESGTSLLFIDSRDQDSLFVFHPDGGDREKTNLSLKDLL